MRIHTNKRAMLMRSVLLVVGIIILSASDCVMAPPAGPDGDGDKPVTFAYICTNGTAVAGTTGVEDTEQCSTCGDGFALNEAKECVATFAYICTDGIAVADTTEAENTEQCSTCNTGFELTSDKQCVTETFAYICTNGIAVVGTTGAANTEQCSTCSTGFVLNGANECVVETFAYICTDGTIAAGTTTTANTEQCSACDAGFELNGANACVADITAPGVVTLASDIPLPSVATVALSWTEPADADFSHLLISWTPDKPTNPIRVNAGTRSTVIPARGLTSGTAYTFTAISVDTTGNKSAASAGEPATPVFDCANPIFATTNGTTYAGSVNVAGGTGAVADPYIIPLVDGVASTCPITIEIDNSDARSLRSGYFRIDNMPAGASYTSSTIAWAYDPDFSPGAAYTNVFIDSAGMITSDLNKHIRILSIQKTADASMDMGTSTDETDLVPTGARTFGFYMFGPGWTDSLTLTLTP